MEGSYIRLYDLDKNIYFHVTIDKKFVYSDHGINYHDYIIKIDEIHIYDKEIDFEDIYGGLFLWKTEDKKVKIYDNIKKNFVEIDNLDNVNHIHFEYNEIKYEKVDMEYMMKEILYHILI